MNMAQKIVYITKKNKLHVCLHLEHLTFVLEDIQTSNFILSLNSTELSTRTPRPRTNVRPNQGSPSRTTSSSFFSTSVSHLLVKSFTHTAND